MKETGMKKGYNAPAALETEEPALIKAAKVFKGVFHIATMVSDFDLKLSHYGKKIRESADSKYGRPAIGSGYRPRGKGRACVAKTLESISKVIGSVESVIGFSKTKAFTPLRLKQRLG